ncbi:uncharacterized protein SPPG_03013 [Spizellomyces punctatus DAOM BR117]|uniref:Major facilitator superfamily (MFS) profile domain-containing protein n=1 Tax=Spizellomyces punctatus (strain DAOM BR117) TaxID=645134 RepID=A0A0L0HNN3_SPIPD|nr:uncharacterized protein SPPG_03013 [Spizellomyces punctatus DAOM BR117]KND02555.1 hypothetical protein SPPG_03013 [Spizellomyces punctatus DAOM BR117]|eukprot:XP_016610594.1 hypothetical protein SPPG_03013 [Spizellomyces punctatus DAOM BR117]
MAKTSQGQDGARRQPSLFLNTSLSLRNDHDSYEHDNEHEASYICENSPLLLDYGYRRGSEDNCDSASLHSRPPSYATLGSPTDVEESDVEIESEFSNDVKKSTSRSCWSHLPPRDTLTVLLSLFITEASRGLVLPTMYTYVTLMGGNLSTLGTMISLFSVGRLICSVPFGTWADKRRSSREVFIFAAVLAAASNTLYAFSWALPRPIYWLYFSRLACGFATGTVAVCRSYLASAVPPAERTKAIAWSGMAQYAGFSLTPGIATLIMYLGGAYTESDTADASSVESDNDKTGTPTLFACILPTGALVLVNILLIPVLLSAMPKRDPVAPVPPTLPQPNGTAAVSSHAEAKLLKWGFVLFFTLNLVLRGVIGVTETIAPELYQHHRVDDEAALEHSGQFFFMLGIIGLVVFFLVDPIQRRLIAGPHLLNLGIAAVIAGTLLNVDPEPERTKANWLSFVGGMTLIWSIGSPVCQTLTVSMYSKMLGKRPQGSLIGWITTAGSIGRILFPFLIGLKDCAAFWVNWMDVVLCFGCAVGVLVFERCVGKTRRMLEGNEEVGPDDETPHHSDDELDGETDSEEVPIDCGGNERLSGGPAEVTNAQKR